MSASTAPMDCSGALPRWFTGCRLGLLLGVWAVVASGCASTRLLDVHRGAPVMVVRDSGSDSQARQEELDIARALALVPLRLWPAGADPDLVEEIRASQSQGGERLAAAREAAEERRLPWLLVVTDRAVRLETTRGGDLLWRGRLVGRQPRLVQVVGALHRAFSGGGKLLGGKETRLAPVETLSALRGLAVESSWESYSA